MRDVVRSSDVGEHLAGLSPSNGLPTLMWGQRGRTPHNDAPGPRTLPSLPGAGPDQLSFELGQAAQDGQHQPSVRCRRVRPGVAQRPEPRTLLSDGIQDVEKVTGRSSQAIEPSDHENVALIQRLYKPRKLLTIGSRTADLLPENPVTIGDLELSDLGRQRLTVCADPGIPKKSQIGLHF